ncbi:hypothetical protein [Kingella sp. (in: b-proteobacteria)]|nr:hypothetical protein [Kingella sp. (in: b-proteobacteria)]MDO4657057.1 hypothetical protein [Kingella sp. (in: b-proteobacteria)]
MPAQGSPHKPFRLPNHFLLKCRALLTPFRQPETPFTTIQAAINS